jgi:hypothetical protein
MNEAWTKTGTDTLLSKYSTLKLNTLNSEYAYLHYYKIQVTNNSSNKQSGY